MIRGENYADADFTHILIIVKPIALAYKKGEGSSQTQGTIFTWKKTPNHPWLDPSVRFFPVHSIGSA